MPTTLSVDLRQRVASAMSAGATCRQAAERFGVSRASASRWSQQKQRVGHVAPKPLVAAEAARRPRRAQAAGRRPALSPHRGSCRSHPADLPGSPADPPARVARGSSGMRGRGQHQQPVALLRPAPDHAEKGALHAAEQAREDVRAARETWFASQPDLDPERLVFLDETAANTSMVRRYGRAPRGARCRIAAPAGHWKTTTVIAGLRTSGPEAIALLDGPVTGERFRAYVAQTLVPTLRPGDTVIQDNLGAHKVTGVREAIEAAGARLLYLPSYSPDFNPIELAFAKLKALLRSAAARTVSDLWEAIREAFARFSPKECRNYFAAAGYEDNAYAST